MLFFDIQEPQDERADIGIGGAACFRPEGPNALSVDLARLQEEGGIEAACGGAGQTIEALPVAPGHSGRKRHVLRSGEVTERLVVAGVIVDERFGVGAYLGPIR